MAAKPVAGRQAVGVPLLPGMAVKSKALAAAHAQQVASNWGPGAVSAPATSVIAQRQRPAPLVSALKLAAVQMSLWWRLWWWPNLGEWPGVQALPDLAARSCSCKQEDFKSTACRQPAGAPLG